MRSNRFLLIALLWGSVVSTGGAANFDGSKPLVCSAMEVVDCDVLSGCERLSPAAVYLPRFLRIDFDKKEIRGDGRTTAIQNMSEDEKQIFMQGVQGDRAWGVALSKEIGSITGTVAGDGYGFVVFGACTTLESLGS